GAHVRVALTPDAERFVGSLTFAALSQQPVFGNLWDTSQSWSQHVHLARETDLMVIAPATANTVAKLAHGQCDNAVLAVALSATCPLLVCPAMDHEMYQHAQTQANLRQLEALGYQLVQPTTGYLASGLEGQGRLAEPEAILEAICGHLGPQPLLGRRVLLTAGPTQEALDPVRYLTNHSTGRMGVALAQAAQAMGAAVTLVAGPLQVPVPPDVAHVPVRTARQMLQAVQAQYEQQDILILTAAVSDYAPETVAEEKIKKAGDTLQLTLRRNPDILAWLGENRKPGQLRVGFALETEHELAHAQAKLEKKRLDCIVLNSLRDTGAGFGHDTNKITLLDQNGTVHRYELKSKAEVAQDILQYLVKK
ncbi:MAG: bifunctional phosphopantothenoylcysteine decarboxylase/phosphopantothenate--cysteine ligase CoaBC, partial [Pseudomonadota bacterium]